MGKHKPRHRRKCKNAIACDGKAVYAFQTVLVNPHSLKYKPGQFRTVPRYCHQCAQRWQNAKIFDCPYQCMMWNAARCEKANKHGNLIPYALLYRNPKAWEEWVESEQKAKTQAKV